MKKPFFVLTPMFLVLTSLVGCKGEKYYTVSFDTKGGTTIADVKVKSGEKLTKPVDPVKEPYKFSNWYTDSGYDNKYDFDNPVTHDMTLYAFFKFGKDEFLNTYDKYRTTFFNSNKQYKTDQLEEITWYEKTKKDLISLAYEEFDDTMHLYMVFKNDDYSGVSTEDLVLHDTKEEVEKKLEDNHYAVDENGDISTWFKGSDGWKTFNKYGYLITGGNPAQYPFTCKYKGEPQDATFPNEVYVERISDNHHQQEKLLLRPNKSYKFIAPIWADHDNLNSFSFTNTNIKLEDYFDNNSIKVHKNGGEIKHSISEDGKSVKFDLSTGCIIDVTITTKSGFNPIELGFNIFKN